MSELDPSHWSIFKAFSEAFSEPMAKRMLGMVDSLTPAQEAEFKMFVENGEAMCTSVTRRVVPLKPGEPKPTYLDIEPPEGFRMETDEEFRARIIALSE